VYGNEEEEIEAIQYSLRIGQNHIDTAQIYGVGHTEEIVGNAIKKFNRSQIFIASKIWKSHIKRSSVLHGIEGMLKRLQTKYIDLVYIPVFWTNIQIHPNFSRMKHNYNYILDNVYKVLPDNTQFFTIVQHDLGVELLLPPNTLVFGGCSGNIPLPLIYEDTTSKLINTPKPSPLNKTVLASFVGTHTTHNLRIELYNILGQNRAVKLAFESEQIITLSKILDEFLLVKYNLEQDINNINLGYKNAKLQSWIKRNVIIKIATKKYKYLTDEQIKAFGSIINLPQNFNKQKFDFNFCCLLRLVMQNNYLAYE
jgi:hypothetical protein